MDRTCPSCGATLYGAPWCGQCYAPRGQSDSTEHPSQSGSTWAPTFEYSRWRAGATTMGPIGRVLTTLLLLGPIVPVWRFEGMLGLEAVGVWTVVVCPIVLHHVWKRDRVA